MAKIKLKFMLANGKGVAGAINSDLDNIVNEQLKHDMSNSAHETANRYVLHDELIHVEIDTDTGVMSVLEQK